MRYSMILQYVKMMKRTPKRIKRKLRKHWIKKSNSFKKLKSNKPCFNRNWLKLKQSWKDFKLKSMNRIKKWKKLKMIFRKRLMKLEAFKNLQKN